jgi:hypothetical protein
LHFCIVTDAIYNKSYRAADFVTRARDCRSGGVGCLRFNRQRWDYRIDIDGTRGRGRIARRVGDCRLSGIGAVFEGVFGRDYYTPRTVIFNRGRIGLAIQRETDRATDLIGLVPVIVGVVLLVV